MCIYTHTTKNPWHKDVIDRQMYDCVGHFCTYPYGLSLNGWRALLCIENNRHGVTITTHATKRHFLIWMTTVRQPTKRRRSCVYLKIHFYLCLLVNETKNPQHLDCGRSIPATHGGIKRFQTRRSLVWNRFIPHSSQVSIYHIKE